jgi:nucleotide-binding universal stress UspA family protein
MVHIKHVLCPVDFSELSRHAFDRAVAFSRSYGADLTVLHVLPVTSAVPVLPYGPEGPGPLGFESVDRDRALGEMTRFLGTEHPIGVPLHHAVVESASVRQEIFLQIARNAADVVVIGTHGRSGFDRFFLGSVAERTLRTSPVPVLVIPPRTPDVIPAGRDPFRSVLCAVDFSQDSARALEYGASLARHAAGRLTLMHAVEPMPIGHDPMVGVVGFDAASYERALEESGRAQLKQFGTDAAAAGTEVETLITRGKAYKEILRIAMERQADLIVVGVHGRNALDRLVFGSTTEHLVRRATCPVLAVPGPRGH